ncbi:MAG: hypothetical protein JO257_06735 [Deltaproteobacteria bacterium]|nr:hypothetical protein [Deltaproteobacteria bacterium]
MRLAVLSVLAACSFQPRSAVVGQGDAPPGSPDGPHVDARPVDARPIDAPPPDACSDQDGDGVCDNVDDWPCGAKPASPPSTVVTSPGSQTTATLTQISANGSQLVVAAPNAAVSVSFHYAITDTACPGNCIDQLEVGWVPGGRAGCVFDQTVSQNNGASGTANGSFAAPGMRGVYDLRVAIGQNYSCTYMGASGWYHGQPASSTTIAKVCVH